MPPRSGSNSGGIPMNLMMMGMYGNGMYGSMMHKGRDQQLRLGPFTGGLNTVSDVTAIADAELTVATNFELDIDGSLVSRTPIVEKNGHINWTERIICICEAVFSGNHYVIGSNTNGVYYYLNGVWTLITSTFQAYAAVQYAGKVYIIPIPGSANPGGKWDPVNGFIAVAAIPQGQAAVILKERLFVVPGLLGVTNSSRLTFSDPGNFDSWTASSFVDIGPGDGTNLIDLIVFQDNLLLFKSQTTYVLSYDIRPSDAVIRKISNTIGVAGQFNVVNYENSIFIFSNGWVYEVVNYDFNRINTKVPFILDTTSPTPFASENIFLTRIQDRLICRYYKKIYVYGLRTRTWTEWSSTSNRLHYFGPIVTIWPTTGPEYYSGSCLSANTTSLKMFNIRSTTDVETVIDPTRTITDTFTRTVSSGWGTSDTGQVWTTTGGAATDFATNGTQGTVSLTSVTVDRVMSMNSTSFQNVDIVCDVQTSVAAAGGLIIGGVRARVQGNSNHYQARIEMKSTGTAAIAIYSVTGSVYTAIGAAFDIGAYVATDTFHIRFQINGTNLQAKLWKNAANEPGGWHVVGTDTTYTTAGTIGLITSLGTGNTNALPVTTIFDNFLVGDMASTAIMITCTAKTKNFDMAVSHRFKRLYWWGADVTTNNNVTGIATPIIMSFNVTWSALTNNPWNSLNTWAQPLTTASSITTVQTTSAGTSRRFIKFLKALRYRQINFQVQLTTNGGTVDGPARLFTMLAVSESRDIVTKGVS